MVDDLEEPDLAAHRVELHSDDDGIAVEVDRRHHARHARPRRRLMRLTTRAPSVGRKHQTLSSIAEMATDEMSHFGHGCSG